MAWGEGKSSGTDEIMQPDDESDPEIDEIRAPTDEKACFSCRMRLPQGSVGQHHSQASRKQACRREKVHVHITSSPAWF
jgi:hypothetical protein